MKFGANHARSGPDHTKDSHERCKSKKIIPIVRNQPQSGTVGYSVSYDNDYLCGRHYGRYLALEPDSHFKIELVERMVSRGNSANFLRGFRDGLLWHLATVELLLAKTENPPTSSRKGV